MSVIGRLDDQVDALLISPLKKRDARQTDEQEATPPEQATETAAQAGQVAPSRGRAATAHSQAERESRAADELPVWLL
jgi:hypothetical protein